MRSTQVDRLAARLLLESFLADAAEAEGEDLSLAAMPTLLVCGTEDDDNGSAEELAAALPDGRYAPIPGTHMTCVTRPELAAAIASFLTA